MTDSALTNRQRVALDLCVACKGCKRDCPTGVDMAKVKIEFTQLYKQRFGYTLKDKLIALHARLRKACSKSRSDFELTKSRAATRKTQRMGAWLFR